MTEDADVHAHYGKQGGKDPDQFEPKQFLVVDERAPGKYGQILSTCILSEEEALCAKEGVLLRRRF